MNLVVKLILISLTAKKIAKKNRREVLFSHLTPII